MKFFILYIGFLLFTLQAEVFDFEKTPIGALPKSFIQAMTNGNDNALQWSVTRDKDSHVLTLTKTEARGLQYNLCYTDKVHLKNGTFSVRFKALSGEEDQGGGIAWRIQDKSNYYVARFNPLEDNFRLYYIKNGYRRLLSSANVHLSNGWHTMRITHKGSRYQAWLDGKKMLEGDDDTITKSGGVGVWSKADALTSFDNLKVEKR